jgi:hypothetical protein
MQGHADEGGQLGHISKINADILVNPDIFLVEVCCLYVNKNALSSSAECIVKVCCRIYSAGVLVAVTVCGSVWPAHAKHLLPLNKVLQ